MDVEGVLVLGLPSDGGELLGFFVVVRLGKRSIDTIHDDICLCFCLWRVSSITVFLLIIIYIIIIWFFRGDRERSRHRLSLILREVVAMIEQCRLPHHWHGHPLKMIFFQKQNMTLKYCVN